jgi:hypothetical protein
MGGGRGAGGLSSLLWLAAARNRLLHGSLELRERSMSMHVFRITDVGHEERRHWLQALLPHSQKQMAVHHIPRRPAGRAPSSRSNAPPHRQSTAAGSRLDGCCGPHCSTD